MLVLQLVLGRPLAKAQLGVLTLQRHQLWLVLPMVVEVQAKELVEAPVEVQGQKVILFHLMSTVADGMVELVGW
ncbi:hypothetical protein JCGZ_03519 [Jatropha curcas]|uniref:Uncharacterized protein n=1 Tax=Jatropha curcas TaxID=180498 RepID=A0A067JD77_JATCU|nr:hypothetical protein JCGZ_03519 [Jatropha curcas]